MIEETYIDYKTAILLKEKGFNEPCSTWWRKSNDKEMLENAIDGVYIWKYVTNKELEIKDLIDDEDIYISAPTHQRVLKWLRDEHKIIISITISTTFATKSGIAYGYEIWEKNNDEERKYSFHDSLDMYLTYEAAERYAINEALTRFL